MLSGIGSVACGGQTSAMPLLSFPARLESLAAADPDRPAVTCSGETMSRRSLQSTATRLARELRDLGVEPGDFVTVALPNSVDWFVAYVACWMLGAVPQPTSAKLPPRELAAIVELAGSKVVIGAPEATLDLLPAGTKTLPLGHRPDESIPDEPLPDATSPAWKAPTSGGSTGRPKLIVSGDPAVYDTDAPLPLGLQPDGALMMPGPLYHNGPGVWACQALLAGNHVVLLPRFDADATLASIETHRCDVVYMVPKGLTTGEVQAHLAETYGTDVSRETISKITDRVLDDLAEWQNRPLDRVYPVIFIDAIVVKIRDGQVANRPVYTAIGVTVDGQRDILGLWIGTGGEGAKYWLQVLTEIKNRGVEDACIVVCDGLKGLPESIEATWPLAVVQTCVLHLIRNTFRLASRRDWDKMAKDLRPVDDEAHLAPRRRRAPRVRPLVDPDRVAPGRTMPGVAEAGVDRLARR